MEALKKLDNVVYRVERAVVVASLVVMAVVVFLDVVHRTFAGDDSKFAEVMGKVMGLFGNKIEAGMPMYDQLSSAGPYVMFVVFVALVFFGIRSAKRSEPVPAASAALYAVAGVLVVYGLIRLMVWAVPNGFIWSQPLALVLTLWVGFVGASMCTHENKHLKVEAVQRLIPSKYKPAVAFLSALATTAVCFALMWLAIRYVNFHYHEWESTNGKGGMFQGMKLPRFVGFSALPIAFGFMTARFFSRAVRAAQGHVDEPGALAPAVGEADDESPVLPSEVETEAMRADGSSAKSKGGGAVQPSEVDTVTSGSSTSGKRGRERKPSKVDTDPHQPLRKGEFEARPPSGEHVAPPRKAKTSGATVAAEDLKATRDDSGTDDEDDEPNERPPDAEPDAPQSDDEDSAGDDEDSAGDEKKAAASSEGSDAKDDAEGEDKP